MLKLPPSVIFTDGNARLPEEGLYLHGFAPDNEHLRVEVRQRNLIQARSDDEAAVLALLAAADFSEEPRGSVTGRASLERIRDVIVNYVQSDLYLEICKHGVRKKFELWRGFKTAPLPEGNWRRVSPSLGSLLQLSDSRHSE